MKLYTSRYQNKELERGQYTAVRITRGSPRFKLGYTLAGSIMELAPSKELFYEKDGSLFREKFIGQLEEVGVGAVAAALEKFRAMGKDVVLCCFEDVRIPGQRCHRIVFADWWQKKTGESVAELPDMSEPKAAK